MAQRSMKNPYPGIDLHLNSALQQRGEKWRSFHTTYLGQLFDRLDELLPEAYTPEDQERIRAHLRPVSATPPQS